MQTAATETFATEPSKIVAPIPFQVTASVLYSTLP